MDNLIANLIAGVTFVMTRHYLCLRSQRMRGVLFHFSFNKFNEDNASLLLFLFLSYCVRFLRLKLEREKYFFESRLLL